MYSTKKRSRSNRIAHTYTTIAAGLGSSRVTSHDQESGLVYDEYQVAATRGASTWITDYRTPAIVRTKQRPNRTNGARRLVDMALNTLVLEAQQLTPEALQSLPWVIGQKIWDQICVNHAESFYTWRAFATAYGYDFASNAHRYKLDIRSPVLPPIDYYRGLNSVESRWYVCLRISPKQVSVPDLFAISNIRNLAVLDMSDGQLYIENRESTFDHRVMRSWSETAKSGRTFANLRVLLLGWQERLDTWLFDHINAFPTLNIVVLTNCRSVHHKNHKDWEELAWDSGWEFLPSKRGVKQLRPLLDDKMFGKGTISNLHGESLSLSYGQAHAHLKLQRPLLECWIGTPRSWSHIIDDFPGTNTVFLQRLSGTSRSTLSQQSPPTKNLVRSNISATLQSVVSAQTSREDSLPKMKAPRRSAAVLLAEMS